MERLVEFMRNDKQPNVVYDDMRSYLQQLDERRGNFFPEVFPELAYLMLACARIGAIHSIIFGGFSPDSISGRINDC